MPFADDVDLPALSSRSDPAFLLEVFEAPLGFRFGPVGTRIKDAYGVSPQGRFLDGIGPREPFERLIDQAKETVERRVPTYSGRPFQERTVPLPLWGEGHIALLLGGVAAA